MNWALLNRDFVIRNVYRFVLIFFYVVNLFERSRISERNFNA